ncbi:MAG: M56 family metallopeptidase, partial [Sedimentisphaerales bacterium]
MEAFDIHLLRVFDWLLWTTIQGSVLIVLIVLIQLVLRRRLPVRWHYLLWVLLLIRLAVPWLPESKMSLFNLVPRSVQQGRIIDTFTRSRNAEPMDFYMYSRFANAPQKTGESRTFFVRFIRSWPVLWLVGTVLIAGYILMQSIRLWFIVKRERLITDSEILDLLEDCKMQM